MPDLVQNTGDMEKSEAEDSLLGAQSAGGKLTESGLCIENDRKPGPHWQA